MSMNFTKFELEMTKRLDAFKTAKEWSDFISLLGSLDTLIKNSSHRYLPKKEYLSKRLNQCLNPLLPAGVHIKALETYAIIFETISETELVKNFGIYTLGLFNFGHDSRMLVMKSYLDVIDKYIIPLGNKIELLATNVLYGLLPSIESHNNEYYNKAFMLINKFKGNIDEKKFYVALWEILYLSDHLKLSVLNYFMNTQINYETMISDKKQIVRSLRKGLESKEALVVRDTLNLINYMFPLKKNILDYKLNIKLLEGMLLIFCKREQGLNKRVFTWLNIDEDVNDEDISMITITLLRILKNNKTIRDFFKIFTTLSDKSNLTKGILNSLLFNVLMLIKDYKEAISTKIYVLNNPSELKQKELIEISKIFVTSDIDNLWKIFYLELRKSIKRNKSEISLGSSINLNDDKDDTNQVLDDNINTQGEDIVNTQGEDIVNTQVEDIVNTQEEDIVNTQGEDLHRKTPEIKSDERNNHAVLNQQTNSGSIKTNLQKTECINQIEGKSKITPTQTLEYIEFCINNYNICDETVLKIHLPILIIYILENKEEFEPSIFNRFLISNINKIKLIDQVENSTSDFFTCINEFYMNENTKILSRIDKVFLIMILNYLLKYLSLDNYEIILKALLRYKDMYNLEYYIRKYYEFMISKPCKVIAASKYLFSAKIKVKEDLLFNELWNRFRLEDTFKYGDLTSNGIYQGSAWNNIQMENESWSTMDSDNMQSNIIESNLTDNQRHESNISKFKSVLRSVISPEDKKELIYIFYDYNKIFKRKFEKLLVKKIKEENKYKLCLFLYLILDLEENSNFYFYNIFFLLNVKLSSKDPVITSLIKSLNSYKEVFKYTLKKIINHNLEVEYNISQMKGILKIYKNMLTYSRRFRMELKDEGEFEVLGVLRKSNSSDTLEIHEKDSACIQQEGDSLGGQESDKLIIPTNEQTGKNEVTEILKYKNMKLIFYNLLKTLFLQSKCVEMGNFENLRKIRIQSISLIENLIKEGILKREDISIQDIKNIINICKVFKNDPAIVLPCVKLVELTDNTELIRDICVLLDSTCFYYFEFLEIIFNLPDMHSKIILPFIVDNQSEEGYSFMIIRDVIHIMMKSNYFNWAFIIKKMITKFLKFFEKQDNLFDKSSDNLSDKCLTLDNSTTLDLEKRNTLESREYFNILAINEISEIFINQYSGYFIEYLVASKFSPNYMKCLSFKEKIYSQILASYISNPDLTFKFLLKFDKILDKQERISILNNIKTNLQQIVNYRVKTSSNILLYLLNAFEDLPNDSSHFLTVIYQTLEYLQKNKNNILIDKICEINYDLKIRSSLQNTISFLFGLVKNRNPDLRNSDINSYSVEKLISLANNNSVTIKNMSRELREYLYDPNFFTFKIKEKAILYKKLCEADSDIIYELINNLESSFFTTQYSDINNKCIVLKRLSYLILINEYNKFGRANTEFIEICNHLLQHSSTDVRIQVWNLIKILFLKIEHKRLLPLFPVIYSELVIFLKRIILEDINQISAVVKLLDFMILQNSSYILEFKNILFGIHLPNNKKEEDINNKKEGVINNVTDISISEVVSETVEESEKSSINSITNESPSVTLADIELNILNKTVPLFEITYKELQAKYNLPISKKLKIGRKKKLLISTKSPQINDILIFFKYASNYYSLLERETSEVDYESLEKILLQDYN